MNKLSHFQKVLKQKGLSAFILTNPVNIFYLTGFKGVSLTEREAILIALPQKTYLVTARLYQNEANKLSSSRLDVKIVDERNQVNKFIKEAFSTIRGQTPKIGFEENNLTYGQFRKFEKDIKGSKLIPVKDLIEDSRVIKSNEEIGNIEKAQKISQRAFAEIVKTIKVGQTEAEIAEKLEKIIKNLGAQALAFETIVASGPNSALPHYVTGNRKISKGEVLLFDFGAKYKNYCADLSRTIFVGKAKTEHKIIYHHVEKAQKTALVKITHNLESYKAFRTASDLFKAQNLHDHFLHSLGHGIGLEVHERPHLSKKSKGKLQEGMVFSIEPGLYFPAWGGVRIEDLVTIKNGRAKILGQKAEFIEI